MIGCSNSVHVFGHARRLFSLTNFLMNKSHQQHDKNLLALEREHWKRSKARWTEVPIKPPIRRGWKRCYFLTQAARRRLDAPVLERILEKINVTQKHWRRDFSPTKRRRREQKHHLDQPLKLLGSHDFGQKRSQLPEECRAWFISVPVFEHDDMKWKLAFREPQLFELCTVPNLQTEACIIDAKSESRLAEIEVKLHPAGWGRLTNLHGHRCGGRKEPKAKEIHAAQNAKKRIRAAYLGDHEAEEITSTADALVCLVRGGLGLKSAPPLVQTNLTSLFKLHEHSTSAAPRYSRRCFSQDGTLSYGEALCARAGPCGG